MRKCDKRKSEVGMRNAEERAWCRAVRLESEIRGIRKSECGSRKKGMAQSEKISKVRSWEGKIRGIWKSECGSRKKDMAQSEKIRR
ncbi:hypothetical protein D1AOALGA4SA_2072 [Olavius algarvensis Delta 1 endosymbiont]|nr:hypothetical protein D1AOALGA4SA_2072 [Olavius algarvensis Delta 1 endosymbiont]